MTNANIHIVLSSDLATLIKSLQYLDISQTSWMLIRHLPTEEISKIWKVRRCNRKIAKGATRVSVNLEESLLRRPIPRYIKPSYKTEIQQIGRHAPMDGVILTPAIFCVALFARVGPFCATIFSSVGVSYSTWSRLGWINTCRDGRLRRGPHVTSLFAIWIKFF